MKEPADCTIQNKLMPQVLNCYLETESSSVFLGISGGSDSMALFWTWVEIRKQKKISFSVIHINHGLRGNESEQDADFVSYLCKVLNVPFYLIRANVKAEMEKRKIGGLEEAARVIRYEGFKEILRHQENPSLFLAHHQEDQVETMLMNLFRGSGSKGLCGIPPVRIWENIKIVRPFLPFSKSILKYGLMEMGYSWREDQSNQENIGNRNKLRNDILPALYDMYPQMGNAIYKTTQILADEEMYWDDKISRWILDYGFFSENLCYFNYIMFINESVSFQRRILRFFFGEILKCYQMSVFSGMNYLDYQQTEEFLVFLKNPNIKKANLPQNLIAEKGKERIYFLPLNQKKQTLVLPFEIPSDIDKTGFQFSNLLFSVSEIDNDILESMENFGDLSSFQVLDLSKYTSLVFRTRQEGDYIYPKGSKGKKSLKKYLIDHKVDRPVRDFIPVLAKDSEILWVVGCGISQKVAVTDQTNRGILIKYTFSYQ